MDPVADANHSSFLFSLDAQVYRTGPVYATVSKMTMDLSGPGGIYGKLEMPEMKITPTETKIHIVRQKITITDMDAFMALSKTLVQQDMASMTLENGRGTVKVLGYFSFPVKFQKTCEFPGMNGPKTEFINASESGTKVTARIYNPSPLEMDLGDATFECRNATGQVLAHQRGKIFITRGESFHEVDMTINAPEVVDSAGDISKLWMQGLTVTGTSWMLKGIKNYHVELPVSEDLKRVIAREERKALDERAANGPKPVAVA